MAHVRLFESNLDSLDVSTDQSTTQWQVKIEAFYPIPDACQLNKILKVQPLAQVMTENTKFPTCWIACLAEHPGSTLNQAFTACKLNLALRCFFSRIR